MKTIDILVKSRQVGISYTTSSSLSEWSHSSINEWYKIYNRKQKLKKIFNI